MPDTSRVQRLGGGRVRYRGKVFLGFNKPRRINHPKYKGEVLARQGGTIAHLKFGARGYRHNYSPSAKQNYLRRSAGIRDKNGQLTKNNKLSKNYWARRVLWPQNKPTTAQKRVAALRRKARG